MTKSTKLNDAKKQLVVDMPLMKCANTLEFKQRLQWLSEGMLQNHLYPVAYAPVNENEIAAYRKYKHTVLVIEAVAIDELAYNLGNISHDDKKEITDYTNSEIVNEAGYVLDLFVNPNQGHINGEALNGDEGEGQKLWAQAQVRQLRKFIKKYKYFSENY